MLNDYLYQPESLVYMFLQWLTGLKESFLAICIILVLALLMLIEMLITKGHKTRKILLRSYFTNINTFIFNNSLINLFSISSLLLLTQHTFRNGLLADYDQSTQMLLCFITFDLTLYFWHKANHDFECLWMFHKVHHCDKSMNSTTAFRIHFVEIILSVLIKAVFIIITGVEIAILALCEAISTLFIMLHHMSCSIKGERWLKIFFIVPSLHKVHHSPLRLEHDNNYGAIFSIWDRIFGTYKELVPEKTGLKQVEALTFYQLLKFGLTSDKTQTTKTLNNLPKPEIISQMIAEAAYYNAEKRGFTPGYESIDWFEAEQQISRLG